MACPVVGGRFHRLNNDFRTLVHDHLRLVLRTQQVNGLPTKAQSKSSDLSLCGIETINESIVLREDGK